MRLFLTGAACLTLAACGSTLNTPHAFLERREIDGETLYVATVSALNAAVVAGKLSQADMEASQRRVWADLSAFRTAYNAGQDVTAVLGTLQSDLKTAQGGK